MRIAIIYDSVFGNTEQVAQKLAAAAAGHEVILRKVSSAAAADIAGAGLVLVGSPTRAFRPTPAISAWLKALPARSLSGIRVAAFDTRADVVTVNNRFLTFMVRFFGYAAEKIARALAARGGVPACPPQWFYVNASEGPLREGELDRAAAWAATLVQP